MSLLHIKGGDSIDKNKDTFVIFGTHVVEDIDEKVINFDELIKLIPSQTPESIFIETDNIKGQTIGKILNFLASQNYKLIHTNSPDGLHQTSQLELRKEGYTKPR